MRRKSKLSYGTKRRVFLVRYTLIFSFLVWGNSCQTKAQDIQNSQDKEISTFYFIRHAEKDTIDPSNRNPDLLNIGFERAERWADIFEACKLEAVYSTNFKRTMHTAMPTAASKKLPILELEYPNIPYDSLVSIYKGKSVLFVGHSNTTPEMVNHFLGTEQFEFMDEDDFGSLFVVTLMGNTANAIRLKLD